jgi:hypothetical protein
MKKNIFSILSLVMLILMSVPSESQEQPAAGVPDSLLASVEDARKRAIDFECPSYFPSDWEAVESQYTDAGNMSITGEDELQQAASLLNSIKDTYDGLFGKTIPLYAQAREDEVLSVRDELIGTGLTRDYPEYLRNADDIALTALDQYEAEDYYTSRDTASAALSEYEALLLAARVYLRRQEIIDRGFVVYDTENFDNADEVALTAIDYYEDGNREAAIESAEEAMLRYNLLLTNGWVTYADDRRVLAFFEREMALINKVNIAVRDSFREADAAYNQAEEIFKARRYDEAAILFIASEALFAIARNETEIKRQRAIETIEIAREKIEESYEAAIEAERIEGSLR